MHNEHPFSLTEKQFKEISARLRESLNKISGATASNAQALQILSSTLFSKPYEEAKATFWPQLPAVKKILRRRPQKIATFASECLSARSVNPTISQAEMLR